MTVVSPTTHDALVERTTDLLRQVSRLMRAGSQEDWVSLSLTRAQLRVLMLLHQDGPAAVGQVASHLGVTLPSVTATVDRLVSQGLVTRQDDPNDRRRVINQLTPAGTALVERLQEGKRARLVAALERLSKEDLRELARTLAVLERALLDLPSQQEE
jgi:DNA-binding MarR family transcriptional regulator